MKMKVTGSKVIDMTADRAWAKKPTAHSLGAQYSHANNPVGESSPTAKRRISTPLIDLVNPQPKAFFAYLRVLKSAENPKKSSSPKRISRGKKRSK